MTSLSNDFQRPSDAPPSYDDVIAENRLLLATLMTSSEGNHQHRNLELMRAMREEWRTDDVTNHGRRNGSDDEGNSPVQEGTSPTTTRITSNRRSRRKYFPHYTEFVYLQLNVLINCFNLFTRFLFFYNLIEHDFRRNANYIHFSK